MRNLSADVVFPISSPPINNGVVTVDDDGTIVSIVERSTFNSDELEIFEGIICPGFINAHCHLELSYMKGKIPEKKGIAQFIIDLIDYRNGFLLSGKERNHMEEIDTAIRNALHEMQQNGIVGIGDISNDECTFSHKAKSDVCFHTFIECLGFFPAKADQYFQHSLSVFEKARALELDASITPHAPYSVPPELFERIFSFSQNHPPLFSYHSQESEAESRFFKNASGDFKKVFEHFKLPLSIFIPTGKNSLQSVIDFFPADKKILFVHNTAADATDIALISEQLPEAYFCFCPNANLYIENQLPQFSLFSNHSDRICIGTDSYASNHQLCILEEIKTIQQQHPSITTQQLLQWATLNGARFFDWDQQFGSLEPGKKPGLNLITQTTTSFQLTNKSITEKLI
ncbi:MAG: amidohydrolase family protein [Chitinophagales bacterium]